MEEKYYEILRHYVNPNDCAIVVKQLLSLHNVSQQREQLKAYTKWLDDKLRDSDELDELIDDYFSSL